VRNTSSKVAGLMLVGWVLTTSCTVAVDSDRVQCESDSDCAAYADSVCAESVCVVGPKWACLDAPVPPTSTGPRHTVPFLVQHIVTQTPLPGVSVRLCRKIDITCEGPLSETLVTDNAGQVNFTVDDGFDGYANFEGEGIIRGLYFFNPPVTTDLPSASISIGSAEVMGGLTKAVGATQQPGRAITLVRILDCTGAPASGVILTAEGADPEAVPFYSKDGLPSGSAEMTDVAGYGGLVNAKPGSITFTATVAGSSRKIGQVTLITRESSITYGSIVPDGS
jgi:hypothetical protein